MAYANVLLTGTVGAGRVRGPGQLGGPAGQLWAAKRGVERPHLSQTLGSEVAQGTSLHLVTPHRQGIWEMTSGWAAMSPGGARAHLGENVSGPWRSEAPVEVTWHWEPSWGGRVRRPHQVPHCPRETGSTPTAALGARWQEFPGVCLCSWRTAVITPARNSVSPPSRSCR